MKKSYKAVVDKKLSKRDKTRWVIIDIETGEVLDDAQGYGYKSPQNAYRGYAYLTRDKSKDAEKKKKKIILDSGCVRIKVLYVLWKNMLLKYTKAHGNQIVRLM